MLDKGDNANNMLGGMATTLLGLAGRNKKKKKKSRKSSSDDASESPKKKKKKAKKTDTGGKKKKKKPSSSESSSQATPPPKKSKKSVAGSGMKDNAAKKLVEALWDGEDDVPNVKSFGDVKDLDSWLSSLSKAISVEDLDSVAKTQGAKIKGTHQGSTQWVVDTEK